MDYKQKSTEFKEKVQSLKDEFIQDILASDLTKLEQLELISTNKLFDIKHSIAQPFMKFYKEYEDIICNSAAYIKKYGKDYRHGVCIDDATIENFQRHETIDFGYYTSDMVSDAEYDNNNKIKIFTNRTTKDDFCITTEQYIDCIYDWCVENKCIGFRLDW